MNTHHYNLLIVEDHPMVTEGFIQVFQHIEAQGELSFTVHQANSFEAAMYELDKFNEHTHPLHLLSLDLHLKPAPDLKLYSGEDFAHLAKKRFPQLKIIIATTFDNHYRIQHVLKEINPDGFMVKVDLNPHLMEKCIQKVLEGEPFYSTAVLQSIRKHLNKDYVLDQTDRKLLYYISRGMLTKNLPEKLHISLSSVERRKRNLKAMMGIEGKDDPSLCKVARSLGFL